MNKKGRLFMITGLLLIAAALLLTVYNLIDESRADKAAGAVLERLDMSIPAAQQARQQAPAGEIPDYILNPNMEMPVQNIDGNDYIGVLEIPALDIALPVMSQWSYDNLKLAPCRYVGSAYLGDLVLAAHNYSAHFGGLKDLDMGESIYFTDVDGNRFSYTVVELEVLQPTAVEDMTSGDWDLTLFTCTLGGQSRVTVRCEKDEALY